MQVRVYYNLHKKMWSVQAKSGKSWKIYTYIESLTLNYVRFRVSEAGRQRVLRDKRKNVHAYAIGEYETGCIPNPFKPLFEWVEVSYNPYREGSFYRVSNGVKIQHAKSVYFGTQGKVFAIL